MRKRKQRALFAAGVDQREGQRAQVIRRQRHKLCPLGADKPVRIGLVQRVSSVMVCKEQGLSQSRLHFQRNGSIPISMDCKKARQQRIRRLEFVLSGQAQCTAVAPARHRTDMPGVPLGHRIKNVLPNVGIGHKPFGVGETIGVFAVCGKQNRIGEFVGLSARLQVILCAVKCQRTGFTVRCAQGERAGFVRFGKLIQYRIIYDLAVRGDCQCAEISRHSRVST